MTLLFSCQKVVYCVRKCNGTGRLQHYNRFQALQNLKYENPPQTLLSKVCQNTDTWNTEKQGGAEAKKGKSKSSLLNLDLYLCRYLQQSEKQQSKLVLSPGTYNLFMICALMVALHTKWTTCYLQRHTWQQSNTYIEWSGTTWKWWEAQLYTLISLNGRTWAKFQWWMFINSFYLH